MNALIFISQFRCWPFPNRRLRYRIDESKPSLDAIQAIFHPINATIDTGNREFHLGDALFKACDADLDVAHVLGEPIDFLIDPAQHC
jgi:transcriptional regulator